MNDVGGGHVREDDVGAESPCSQNTRAEAKILTPVDLAVVAECDMLGLRNSRQEGGDVAEVKSIPVSGEAGHSRDEAVDIPDTVYHEAG